MNTLLAGHPSFEIASLKILGVVSSQLSSLLAIRLSHPVVTLAACLLARITSISASILLHNQSNCNDTTI